MSTAARISLFVVLAAASSTACVTARAASPAERPALEVPPPPPRVVPIVPAPEPPAIEAVEDVPTTTKPSSPVRNARPPAKDPKETAKPEQKPETPPTESPQQPAPQLRVPQGDAAALSRQISDSIDRTWKALNGIDYNALPAARKKAYDDAKLFAQQAQDALKTANLVFAKELADKAERLAKELQGR